MSGGALPLVLLGVAGYELLSHEQRAAVQTGVTPKSAALHLPQGSALAGVKGAPFSSTHAGFPFAKIAGVVASPGELGKASAALGDAVLKINRDAKAKYDALGDEAKKAGATALSKALHITPPLDGSESWDTVGKVVGAAAGRAALQAVIPIPGAGALGAMVGAYLGVKLTDWVHSEMTTVVDDVVKGAKTVEQKVVKDVTDTVEGAYKTVSGWL